MPLESFGATTPETLSPRPAKRSLATLPGLCLSIPEAQLHKDADDREHRSQYHVYTIEVSVSDSEEGAAAGRPPSHWVQVSRRYTDFERFHAQARAAGLETAARAALSRSPSLSLARSLSRSLLVSAAARAQMLRGARPADHELPKLPPKGLPLWSEAAVEKRREQLEAYLHTILRSPGLCDSKYFYAFIGAQQLVDQLESTFALTSFPYSHRSGAGRRQSARASVRGAVGGGVQCITCAVS